MRFFSRLILKYAGIISLIGTLLAGLGGYYSVQLYKNLRTNFEELLPTSSRSVIDLNEVTHRLTSISNLAILIFSEHPKESKRFVLDLTKKLNQLPKSLVSSVEYQITPEIRFFKDRQALYLDLDDLKRIENYIQDRISYETQLYNPLNIFSEIELKEPHFDFNGIKQKYGGSVSNYEKLPDGFYATADEKKRAILVYLAGEGGAIDRSLELKKKVEEAIQSLNPHSYAPDLEVKYTGQVQDTIEEHHALIEDLELSTIIVIIVVTLAMILFYRNFGSTFALCFSLFMGTLWTFGASYFLVGYLNANSAFLGSIVLGNGINFGIITLARYLEERRKGQSHEIATETALSQTATSTLTAALGAGLSYGSLMLTTFRGFNQFGVIGLAGMILCWLSSFFLLPAYLTLIERLFRWRKKTFIQPGEVPTHFLSQWIASAVQKFPKTIWGFSFILLIASLAMFERFNPNILETNLDKLRNKESLIHGSAYLSRYLDEIFQHYLSPLVILARTQEDADKITESLRKVQKEEGPSSLIASVQTLNDFIPKQQNEKIEVLKNIQKLLSPKIWTQLSDSDKKQASDFLNYAAFQPFGINDLPPLILNKFTEKDGSRGKLILIEPPLVHEPWGGDNVVPYIKKLRTIADSVKPGTPIAGSLTITSDMVEAISKDGPKATLFAFVSVILLVVFLFRNVQTIFLILFSLLIGVIWLGGFVLGFWFKINFLNFIALPITFGIGVDYGVNIFQRYREEGGANIISVIRNTGGAVLLSSFTTIVGYASLLIAGNQGFVSFGTLAVAGEVTCVVAAVIALPAFLYTVHGMKKKKLTCQTPSRI